MDYTQLRTANPHVPGQSDYCLIYVHNSFSVPSNGTPTAAAGWSSAKYRHTGTPPSNIAVPIWFSWGSAGHVALWDKGVIWSVTAEGVKSFPTIAALEAWIKGGISYLGWSEDVDGVRVVQPVANPAPAPNQPHGLPAVGSRVQLVPTQTRTTWKVGTAVQAGTIKVTDNTFEYVVRGYDSKYPGRIVINSASGGGNGVGLALYYNSGQLIAGWKVI